MSASLIGLGGIILEIISKKPINVDQCWDTLNKKYIDKGIVQQKHTFDNMILAIDLLYMLGSINYKNGYLIKEG
jgi:hypothetical protein